MKPSTNKKCGLSVVSFLVLCGLRVDATLSMELPILHTSEVFFLPMKQYVFNGLFGNKTQVKYRASIQSMPDLPDWIYFVQEPGGEGYLYGVPTKPGTVNIEIIATNKADYEQERDVITLQVEERERRAKNEVEIRFSNLNVEDMFQEDRLKRVVNIFRTLWPSEEEVYVTLVASAIHMGGRLPPNPRDKEGVVVRIGSEAEFSMRIIDLEQEVIPLRVRVPCPKDYKRTAAERFFRDDNFIPDWCGFRLHPAADPLVPTDNDPIHSPIHLTSNDFNPPSLMEPPRDFLLDFILTIIVPTSIAFMLLLVLSFFMCCYREGIDRRNKDMPSIQMVQYASIHRASNNLRSLATKREGPFPLGTPNSTLPHSYGSSPNNTLPKTSTPKRIVDDKGSLNRQPPPPYAPPTMNHNSVEKPIS